MTLETEREWEVPYYQELEDQRNSKLYEPQPYQDKSQAYIPITEKKSFTNEDERSELKHDMSVTLNQIPIQPKNHRSLLPEIMNRKIKSAKSEIVVYFFNTNHRIVFTRTQLKQFFGDDPTKMSPTLQNFIPFIVKQYCKLFLYFEPLEVNHEYF